MKDKTIRADKLLSSLGIASRRGIEVYLKTNSITANGKRIKEHGERIPINSEIRINGHEIKKPKKVYFILNKPKGYVSTAKDEFGRKNVVSIVKTDERIFPVGRLDRDTHGLLILTNDGELTNMLIHPRYHIGKTYILTIKGQIAPPQIDKLQTGIELEDGLTQKTIVKIVQRKKDGKMMELTIFEGKKRQIRRMCEALRLTLLDLERIRFGNIDLDGLALGEYRPLTGREMEKLKLLTSKKSA